MKTYLGAIGALLLFALLVGSAEGLPDNQNVRGTTAISAVHEPTYALPSWVPVYGAPVTRENCKMGLIGKTSAGKPVCYRRHRGKQPVIVV